MWEPLDEYTARNVGMERIYLNLFRYNAHLSDEARDAYFMDVIPINVF